MLALQGAYEAHAHALTAVGARALLVRSPPQLAGLDGIIIPGGESSTFLRHLERDGFFDALQLFVRQRPTFGTCAGAILLAAHVENPPQRSLAMLDLTIERNAYGRQLDSTILHAETSLPGGPLEMVFIRAPRITHMGSSIEVLASRDGSPVLVRSGHILAATFHPELSADLRIHRLFAEIVLAHRATHDTADPVEAVKAPLGIGSDLSLPAHSQDVS